MLRFTSIVLTSLLTSPAIATTVFDCSVKKAEGDTPAVEWDPFSLTLDDSKEAEALQDLGIVADKRIALALYRTYDRAQANVSHLALQFEEYHKGQSFEGRWSIAGGEIPADGGSIWAVLKGSFRERNAVTLAATCVAKAQN